MGATMGQQAPRFGYHYLLRRIGELLGEAGGAATESMDRRRVLARLCAELNAPETLLLERGFDKAYRQIVEGV
jgi:hypothetical protein